jgi:hypothetical protein
MPNDGVENGERTGRVTGHVTLPPMTEWIPWGKVQQLELPSDPPSLRAAPQETVLAPAVGLGRSEGADLKTELSTSRERNGPPGRSRVPGARPPVDRGQPPADRPL